MVLILDDLLLEYLNGVLWAAWIRASALVISFNGRCCHILNVEHSDMDLQAYDWFLDLLFRRGKPGRHLLSFWGVDAVDVAFSLLIFLQFTDSEFVADHVLSTGEQKYLSSHVIQTCIFRESPSDHFHRVNRVAWKLLGSRFFVLYYDVDVHFYHF